MRHHLARAACAVLVLAAGTAAAAGPPPSPSPYPITYEPAGSPALEKVRAEARRERALERIADFLGVLRLPRPLLLRMTGCDGEINAWYDPDDHSVTFCYEFMASFQANAPSAARERGLSRDEAVIGPFAFFFLHEVGHAAFDILRTPILGREEDAADAFAAFTLLASGQEIAWNVLRGTAWAFAHDARSRTADESDYADVHGLDAQRYYNVLCLAYGSDPKVFEAAVTRGGLPQERADGCVDEWRQVRFALQTLLGPYVDREAWDRVRQVHAARMRARGTFKPLPSPPPAAPSGPTPAR